MPRSRRITGLYKTCPHLWESCNCPWYARYRRHQGISLARWYGVPAFANKQDAVRALHEFKHQIDAGVFTRQGRTEAIAEERKASQTLTFSGFLERYTTQHLQARQLRSTSTPAVLAVFEKTFGRESLVSLSRSVARIEHWLDQQRDVRKWAPTTFNRYHETGRALFNWARRKGLVEDNPFERIERLSTRGRQRHVEITPTQEEALFAALGKLSEKMETQMRPRLCAALDCGLRAGEMLRVQRKHVGYGGVDDVWVIHLPASITKAGEDQRVYVGSTRLKAELQKRRFLDDDAYVFGTGEGRFVASFDKSWQRLFRTAGLAVGRKTGLVWHDLRHEYGMRVAEQTDNIVDVRDMMRHKDIRTSNRYLTAREKRLKALSRLLGGGVS